ncbi:IclR family transcriptional regulator [Natrinema gelatinilyticum]|uniref:IclR family transcriptional regulator n=1 Tax=Natrinema gelatinilyticum TaxID=2961571 RepID=UPI0020C33D26|nr:IclR family transcriptional regulator [Natrinema gelatinilyticum]
MGKNDAGSAGVIKSISRGFRIVETLKELDGARVSELASELDMANSTAHRYLTSLEANEYVIQEGYRYYPSMEFLNIGDYVRNRKEAYRLAEEKVAQLAETTDERAEYLVEECGHVVFVHCETGAHAVQADSHLGKRLPIHATSAGKAIMAFLPDERVMEIIERHDLESYTANTITDSDVLRDELAEIRERNVAFATQEYIQRMNTVSVPVMDVDGQVCGALGISGPTHRMKGEWFRKEIPDLLLGTANELEINVSYQ